MGRTLGAKNKVRVNEFTNTGLDPHLLTLPKDHEYVWDKVQRERAEGHPKFLGGNYHTVPKTIIDGPSVPRQLHMPGLTRNHAGL